MLHIVNIVGARPNLMKIAPLIREMDKHSRIAQTLVHTGQHYDDNLSTVFFDQLRIPRPTVNLGVGSGTRERQIAEITARFEPYLTEHRPELVVVVGDVNSTIACARVAKALGIEVAHVEAGLRSFDLSMPEEHNRTETDAISDLLFVTEPSGVTNLENEGAPGEIHLVGNLMIDTLIQQMPRAQASTVLTDLGLEPAKYAVGTFHRPSNVDDRDRIEALVALIEGICERTTFVLPLHPRTRHSLERFDLYGHLQNISSLVITDPLGYLDFLRLLIDASAVVTDSGGIQEETTYLGVPCLTMRENTERPITLTEGTNRLVGTNPDKVLQALDDVLVGEFRRAGPPALWDGHTAERIVDILMSRRINS